MRMAQLTRIACLAAAATFLASCAPSLPQTALERRYIGAVQLGPRWRPAVQRPATEEERLDAEMEALVRGEVRDVPPTGPAMPPSDSFPTELVMLPIDNFPVEPVVPPSDNFERCIGGLPNCTPGLLTITQRAQVRERWGPRDYTHCPAGWTNCDMSRRTPSNAEAERRRDEAPQALARSGRSYGGYGSYGGGHYGGGCGSRGGPGFRLNNGKCASWRDAR